MTRPYYAPIAATFVIAVTLASLVVGIPEANAMWATYGSRAPWHSEGGKGTPPYAVQFQLRPHPLAGAN